MSGFNFTSVRMQFVALGVSMPQEYYKGLESFLTLNSNSCTLLVVHPYQTVSHTYQLTASLDDALEKKTNEYGLKG
jgi:hypothetical protein